VGIITHDYWTARTIFCNGGTFCSALYLSHKS